MCEWCKRILYEKVPFLTHEEYHEARGRYCLHCGQILVPTEATRRADEMQKEIQALDTEIEALYRVDLERETRSWRGALKQRKEEIRKAEEAFRRTMNLCYEANREKKCMFCLDRDECEAYKAGTQACD